MARKAKPPADAAPKGEWIDASTVRFVRSPSTVVIGERVAPEPIGHLTAAEATTLRTGVVSAHENNLTTDLVDGADRRWFVGLDIVKNHSTVLIQVRRGEREKRVNLSTSACTPDMAAWAIADLDAAFAA